MRKFTIHQKGAFLKDAVFAASDGIVTTFAIVAGSLGASLSPRVIVILGFANLFADGFSMASGNYIGVKSEVEYEGTRGDREKEGSPFLHGLIGFLSFVIIGFIPLIPYVFFIEPMFEWAVTFVILALFMVGAIRSQFTGKSSWRGGLEMLFVGGIASVVAFAVGYFLHGVS